MDCCGQCFCFKDPRRAFVGIGFFTMLLSLVQVLTTVAEFTGEWSNYQNSATFLNNAKPIARTVYILYIALACFDFLLLIFSLVLLCGNERTDEAKAKTHFMPWIIFVPFYVIYESAINIFYFYNVFHNAFDPTEPLGFANQGGFSIIPIVYWVIKDILLIYGWMFVAHHFQHYCPCRPVYFHSSAPGLAHAAAPVYFQATTVAAPNSSCKTCGAYVSQSPAASPSCGCNSGFKMVQQTPMIQAPALRYNQYVDIPAQPAYGIGNQMGGMAKPTGWTSSVYNGFFNRNN